MANKKEAAAPKAAKTVKEAPAENAVRVKKPAGYTPNLQKKYKEEIIGKLTQEFGYTSVMQVPKLAKITINQGVGAATGDKKLVK